VPQIPGLYLANGFSGHGVMHSPATGKVLADLIMHGHSDLIDARASTSRASPKAVLSTKPLCCKVDWYSGSGGRRGTMAIGSHRNSANPQRTEDSNFR